jgi:hypothetical protein
MKVKVPTEIEGVSDVLCDVSHAATRGDNGGLQSVPFKSLWVGGLEHDDERCDAHLRRRCIFKPIANLEEQRCIQGSPTSYGFSFVVKYGSFGASRPKTSTRDALTTEEFDKMMSIYADAGDWMLDQIRRRR